MEYSAWHLFKIMKRTALQKFRETNSGRFQDILVIPMGLENVGIERYEVFVRTYLDVPEEILPARGFRQVSVIRPGEVSDYKAIKNVMEKSREIGGKNCLVSFITTCGPAFVPFSTFPGEFERDYSAFSIIWMRWILANHSTS